MPQVVLDEFSRNKLRVIAETQSVGWVSAATPPVIRRTADPHLTQQLPTPEISNVVMVGLVPTIHRSTSCRACGWLDPRGKPEDDRFGEPTALQSNPERAYRSTPV